MIVVGPVFDRLEGIYGATLTDSDLVDVCDLTFELLKIVAN